MHFRMANPPSFDWSQARAFLAAAEGGSFSAAARTLGLTQPTLGRQVAALEQALGVTLFERGGRTLALTGAGLELLEHVRAMGDAANRLALAASGQSQAVEGQVTISATDIAAAYHLPDALRTLRQTAPGITVEIVASNAVSDLRRREADIAIRHVRPEQPDLIARKVREITAHFWAARDYLDRHGRPTNVEELAAMDFVGFENPPRMVAHLNAMGIPVTERNFRIGSANGVVSWQLVRKGFGVGVMTRDAALLSPEVECLLPELDPIRVPVWLVTHRELRTSRRIRIVFDILAEALSGPRP